MSFAELVVCLVIFAVLWFGAEPASRWFESKVKSRIMAEEVQWMTASQHLVSDDEIYQMMMRADVRVPEGCSQLEAQSIRYRAIVMSEKMSGRRDGKGS